MAGSLGGWPRRAAVTAGLVAAAVVTGGLPQAQADTLTSTIPLGDYVVGAAVSPDGNELLVTRSPNLVDVVSTLSNTVTSTITAGDNPRDVEFSADGSAAYVPNYGDNTVTVIDGTTLTVTNTIPVGSGNPTDVALSPTRSIAYVTKVNADLVAVVDLTNGNVIDSITTGDGPNSVAFTPNGERAFVANESGDSVTIIDATTDSVIGTTAVGDNPFALAITPDGSRVYVTNYGSRSITVLNAGTGSVMGSPIPLAGQPLKFSFTPNGTRAVVATRSPNAAEFVEVASGTSTNSVALGSGPLDVAITPNAGTAYVTNFSAFSVSVISMTATPGAPTSVAGTPGNGEVDLTWTAPTEIGGAPILGYRVEKQLDGGAWEPAIANTGSTSTSATVSGLSNGTGFRFRVAAINSAGPGLASDPSALIVPGLPPGIPTGLTGTPGNAEVLLSWTAPGDDGGTPITGYRIETETDGGPWTTTTANTGTTATTATITGLTNGTPHRFRVSAINTAGPSTPSTPTSTVTPRTTPGTPTDLTGTPGNGQIQLSWIAPSDDGGSPITGYRIESKAGANPWTEQTASTGSNATSANIVGLTNGIVYEFRVSAINAAGTGPASDPSTPTTPRTTPGAPGEPTGTPGNGQVELSWTAPSDDGGSPITGYRIEVQPTGGSWSTAVDDTASAATTASVSGLTNGSEYRFRASAINSAGNGAASTQSEPVTPRTTPGQVRDVLAEAQDQQVLLSWEPPSYDGGADIIGYRIEKKVGSDNWVVATTNTGTASTTTTLAGLSNGTEYRFRVSALNSAGAGSPSDPSPTVIPRTVPGMPTGVQATPGNGQATLAWVPPFSDGGASITGYRIESKVGDDTWTVAQSNTGSPVPSAVVSGLANGLQYRFRVAAINAAGPGSFSAQSEAITPITVPDAPDVLDAIPLDEKVDLSWNAPADTGGSPLTGYRIEVKEGNAAWAVSIQDTGSVGTSRSISGLNNGTEYRFRVSAINAAGPSLPSAAFGPVIPRTTPGSPTEVAGTPGDRLVDLTWTPPASTGGLPISGYRVESKAGSEDWQVVADDTGTGDSSFRVDALTNGVSYRFRVAALSAAGAGSPSATTEAITPRTTPSAPTGLGATPGDESVDLTWIAPSDSGGAPVTGYRIELKPAGGSWTVQVVDTGTDATTRTLNGLSNGNGYRFRVTARNAAGLGQASESPPEVFPLTTPGPPREVMATGGDGRVDLVWLAPVSDGGSPVNGYRIELKPVGGTWATALADTLSSTRLSSVTGLQNGTAYSFRVAALNAAGVGTVSWPSSEVTPTAQAAPTLTPKASTSVAGWPARVKPKGGKARLTVEISPARGRLMIVQAKVCTRKKAKTKCRWVQSSSRQLPAREAAIVKVSLRPSKKRATEYRLVIPATQDAKAAKTRAVKVLPKRG